MGSFVKQNSGDEIDERNLQNLELRLRFRKLHHVNDEDLIRVAYNGTSHKIRHKKKLRKFNERFTDKYGFNESDAISKNVPVRVKTQNLFKNSIDYGISENRSVIFKNVNNKVNYGGDIVKEKVDIHENCYTTNEVLEIIAVTCLVNFIFWFLIISCVNFYTRKEKVKYPSWESVESAGVPSEYEMKSQHEKSHCPHHLRRSISGSDYVDEGLENNYVTQTGDTTLDKRCDKIDCYVGINCLEDDRVKWAVFHDENSDLKDWKSRRKYLGASSHSMENLIF